MARIPITTLVALATLVDTGSHVFQDPPVRKSAVQFRDDVVQAGKSGGNLVREVRSSWVRHGGASQAAPASGPSHA